MTDPEPSTTDDADVRGEVQSPDPQTTDPSQAGSGEPTHRADSSGSPLPLWFRMFLLTLLAVYLGYQLFVKGDTSVSLLLAGTLGAALGADELSKRLGGKGQ